jgi:MOSC domain-containing protein YiiM
LKYIGRAAHIIPAMSKPVVISVNMSSGGIPKLPVESAQIARSGLVGDAHDHAKHNTPLQAVSIIDIEDLDDLRREGFDVDPGATGENLTVRDLNVDGLSVGDRLAFAGGVEIELTRARQPCFVLDSIDPQLKKAILGRCGFLAKVVCEGEIRAGEDIEVIHASQRRAPASASA